MKMTTLLAATALGLTMAATGALAASPAAQTQGTQQTTPSAQGSGARDDVGTPQNDQGLGANSWFKDMTAGDLVGKQVQNQGGEEVGEIDKLVVDSSGRHYAVVSGGGFLGIGDRVVLIPLDRMQMGSDDAVLLTAEAESQLKEMPSYDENSDQFSEVTRRDQSLGE